MVSEISAGDGVRLNRRRTAQRDGGATQIILLMAMVCAFGLTLLAVQVAQANDLQSRAQTAADAAAIGAVTPLRDAALQAARSGAMPDSVGLWSVAPDINIADPVYNQQARKYAERNDARLTSKTHPSGMFGYTMKVTVQTKTCQVKKDDELTAKDREDLARGRNLCTDGSGRTGIARGHGAATAIAELRLPKCRYIVDDSNWNGENEALPTALLCDNVPVWRLHGGAVSRGTAIRLFKIRLVGKEDPTPYTGFMPGYGDVPPGGVVKNNCGEGRGVNEEKKRHIDSLPFGQRVVAWAECWLGTDYRWGGGNASGPSTGICCSPGGHDGRIGVGFDCSGLTLYAVYQASHGRISLGHYTGNQISDPRGQIIPRSALQPGDLVFFGNPTHHVAIYAGGGQMIEAPQTGDVVKYSNFTGRSGFSGARRFG